MNLHKHIKLLLALVYSGRNSPGRFPGSPLMLNWQSDFSETSLQSPVIPAQNRTQRYASAITISDETTQRCLHYESADATQKLTPGKLNRVSVLANVGDDSSRKFPTKEITRTSSIVGTLEYMAPEVLILFGHKRLHKDGYTASIDYWSLGILVYTLLVGVEPYRGYSYEFIQSVFPVLLAKHKSYHSAFLEFFGEIEYNYDVLTDVCKDFLKRLLKFDADARLGYNKTNSMMGHNDLMNHPFFSSIDWSLLELKQIAPCYIPETEILSIMTNKDKDKESVVPVSLNTFLEEHGKAHWVEDGKPINSIITVPSTSVDRNRIAGPTAQDIMRRKARMIVKNEDQHFFRMWNYVNPKLLELSPNPSK